MTDPSQPLLHQSGMGQKGVTEYAPTNVYDEWFSDELGTSWLVKSEHTPTRNAARMTIAKMDGEPYIDYGCRTKRARIEWHGAEGWWLTIDPEGPYEVWEVYVR